MTEQKLMALAAEMRASQWGFAAEWANEIDDIVAGMVMRCNRNGCAERVDDDRRCPRGCHVEPRYTLTDLGRAYVAALKGGE